MTPSLTCTACSRLDHLSLKRHDKFQNTHNPFRTRTYTQQQQTFKNNLSHVPPSYVPSSCGNSWQKTAMELENPVVMEVAKAAPIAIPSVKLWMPSPMMTIQATELTLPGTSWECPWCPCPWLCPWPCPCPWWWWWWEWPRSDNWDRRSRASRA